VEAARAGYRVLVAVNNPLVRFLMEMAATPPSEDDLRVALADLAAARKGDQRIEPLLQRLYETVCAQCGRSVVAEAFIWDREADTITGRIYHCAHCGDAGERPASPQDLEHANRIPSRGLHHAWALERVTPVDDPDRSRAESALDIYLPRALYALFTLINKMDGMPLTPERRRLLAALLISACDRGNNLWPHPSGRARPRQLSNPPRHFEHNVWQALETATQAWGQPETAVALTYWPEPPPESGGISIFEGRLRDLAPALPNLKLGGIFAGLPRPNQAFWTLSAIWSAWLWGRESLGPFKSVLRRRRYDWSWHTTALHAAFRALVPQLPSGTRILGLSGEGEPGMFSAAIIGAHLAGLALDGLAFRVGTGQTRITWTKQDAPPRISATPPGEAVQQAARAGLLQRGQPTRYLAIHASALAGMARNRVFDRLGENPPAVLSAFQDALQDGLTYQRGFLRFGGSQLTLEAGRWWLRDTAGAEAPLADRLELELFAFLQANPGCAVADLDEALCRLFPGLETPPGHLVQACLDSYGDRDPETGDWHLRPQDELETRQADREEVCRILAELAGQMDFRPEEVDPVRWVGPLGDTTYVFYVLTDAVIGEALLTSPLPGSRSFIVLPGGRANLVLYKLKQDPRLQKIVDSGWRFLKFRHLRRLADNPILNRDTMDDQFALDPLTYSEPQIPLF
jgi:hypothetical protein